MAKTARKGRGGRARDGEGEAAAGGAGIVGVTLQDKGVRRLGPGKGK